MITLMNYSQHGFHGPFVDILAEYKNDRLYYRIQEIANHDSTDIFMEDFAEFSGNGKQWLKKLEDVGVLDWKDKYEVAVLDGTDWTLDIKTDGEKSKKIFGFNCWPDNFSKFAKLLDELYNDSTTSSKQKSF